MLFSQTSALDNHTDLSGDARTKVERSSCLPLILLSLGIVYGDLGTSPLYTLKTIIHLMGPDFTAEAALGSVASQPFSQLKIVDALWSKTPQNKRIVGRFG